MTLKLVEKSIAFYLKRRWRKIKLIKREPHKLQKKALKQILAYNQNSEYGKKFSFDKLSEKSFHDEVPVIKYESIKMEIERMMLGEKDVLVPGVVTSYAKSSGTTSARSKFIPVTKKFYHKNILKSCWDAVTLIYHDRPNADIFYNKSLIMGGSIDRYEKNNKTTIGDISAIMIDRIPPIGRPYYTPDFSVALLSEWEEKIERMAHECIKEKVVLFGGVPTWNIVLFNRILEITGKKNLAEVWPEVHTYLHGGVGFKPYKAQFESYVGKKDFDFREVYNASEGYFAIQDNPQKEGMLLLLDNGIYYEFVDPNHWKSENPPTVSLEHVEKGKNYAIVITSYNGLYRYMPGDTVIFTSTSPYRIMVSGRTEHFINVFGEEVMVGNTDAALAITCRKWNASVKDYTVGPIHLTEANKGGHEWFIEFDQKPDDLAAFSSDLDKNLRNLNSDYDAKRTKDLALQELKISILKSGSFHFWLKSKGKEGGQNKIPRLSNNRKYLEELIAFTR